MCIKNMILVVSIFLWYVLCLKLGEDKKNLQEVFDVLQKRKIQKTLPADAVGHRGAVAEYDLGVICDYFMEPEY